MKERIALFIILMALVAFLYVFQYHVNTVWAYAIMLVLLLIYGLYFNLALYHNKRKLKKQPLKINEDYKPFVSIMIPAHNEEYVIANTVDNILQLNYQNFEIIVIDDRSTDNTHSVIENLATKYKDKVVSISRDKNAFPGKSAVLNDALKIAKGEAILVFDADATVEPDFLSKMIPCLEPKDVGAVQSRKVIRNDKDNLLTKCQYNEYVLDNHIQVGRDAIKGAVELRGNGELIKRRALDDINGWNNYTITDDLDMSTRLHIKGWDIRYCPSAEVYEEGIDYVVPLYRQRRRWLEGTIRRYLEYSIEALVSKKMSLRAKLDMTVYISQFIIPLWMIIETCIRIAKVLAGSGAVKNEVTSSAIIAILAAVGFFTAIHYSLKKYEHQKGFNALAQSACTSIYMLIIWFPMALFICGKILFCKKDMNWGKTAHGLVLEEEENMSSREELQGV